MKYNIRKNYNYNYEHNKNKNTYQKKIFRKIILLLSICLIFIFTRI